MKKEITNEENDLFEAIRNYKATWLTKRLSELPSKS